MGEDVWDVAVIGGGPAGAAAARLLAAWGRATVIVTRGSARHPLDCSGGAGVVARDGWRRPVDGARTTALVAVWNRDSSWNVADETHTIVESYAQGWAWSVPVSPSERFVTVMTDPALTDLGGR